MISLRPVLFVLSLIFSLQGRSGTIPLPADAPYVVFEGEKSKYSEVVQFHYQKRGLRECSATVVGENVLITNSHCIQGIRGAEFWLSDASGNRALIQSDIKCLSNPEYLKLDSEAFWNENSQKRSELEEKTIRQFEQWKKSGLEKDKTNYIETKAKLSEAIKESDLQVEKIGIADIAVCTFDKGKKLKELKTK